VDFSVGGGTVPDGRLLLSSLGNASATGASGADEDLLVFTATALSAFSVTGVSGDGSDIFMCTPGSLGSTTTCTWFMYWDGSVEGFSGQDTDSLSVFQ
jgi:hypothetical protein